MQRVRDPHCLIRLPDRRPCGVPPRRGITLLEVVLALGLFLGAMAALTLLSESGMKSAVQSRLQTHAVLRCESKLAELVAGIEPLEAVTKQPFEDDSRWTWTLQIGDGPHADVLLLTVLVEYEGSSATSSTSYSLSRLVRDPAVFEEAAAAAAEAEEGA